MTIVKIKDKRIGVTYVYEQTKSVWDPKRKQSRNTRRLIGKVDDATGEIVPTRGWGKNRIPEGRDKSGKNYHSLYLEQAEEIKRLREENARLTLEVMKLKEEKGKE